MRLHCLTGYICLNEFTFERKNLLAPGGRISPQKSQALQRYGIEVVERVPLEVPPTEASRDYLRAKREKLVHLLSLV